MKKRFIIGINKSTTEQEQAFISFLDSEKLEYWHWLTNIWMIVDSTGRTNSEILRDQIKIYFPGEHNMVFELNNDRDTWSGYGPAGEKKNMFKWIQDKWVK